MLRDGSVTIEGDQSWATNTKARVDWRQIDRKLRTIAKKRCALDAAEAKLLVQAERVRIWSELGFASLYEYMERVLGHGPKAAQDRLRVAKALQELPELAEALATGELCYSALRELVRTATPTTERAWRDFARGKTLRQIEDQVSGRKEGDLPTTPPDPELRMRVLRFEVTPATFALVRQAQQVLEDERGMRLDDDQLVALLCGAVLEPSESDAPGRAKFQIAISRCDACGQGRQHGAGAQVAIDGGALARAECDAVHIGDVAGDEAERAAQSVPPSVRRMVVHRDGNRCRVPGCRASRNLEVHHIVFRSAGGTHDPENCIQLCDGHHVALHDGKLSITGTASALDVTWIDGLNAALDTTTAAHVSPRCSDPPPSKPGAKLARVTMKTEAKKALKQLGFTAGEVNAAIEAAIAKLGEDIPLDKLLFEALRCCPKPH